MHSNTQNRKNALGNRSDIGWEHGVEIDNDPMKIQCKYCNEIISGNIFRFKHHLAGTKKDVKACESVPIEVSHQMCKVLAQNKSSKRKTMNDEGEEMVESVPHERGKSVMDLRDEDCQPSARFLRTSDIPFSCAKNPDFAKKLKCDLEFVPPSYQELEKSSLEKKKTIVMHEKYRCEWKKTGCSIICDEWTNMRGISTCKFFVNSPMSSMFLRSIDTSNSFETTEKLFEALDQIVEEVGEENVIQVITNNDANYRVAMEMLIEKRKRIFWSPCVIQLLDGILKDFESNLLHHWIIIGKVKKISTFICSRTDVMLMLRMFTGDKDLSIPKATQSVTAYLTLLSLIDMKNPLIAMFSSEQWKSYEFAKTKEGEEIQQIILDCGFWTGIDDCLNFALPIIEVLVKIYSDEKPNMGFIYKEMNCANDSLQSLNNVKGCELIWKIINDIRIAQHHPLYVASYLLNPQLHFDSTCKFPSESDEGPYTYLARMAIDYDDNLSMTAENLKMIENQIVDFSLAKGLFGSQAATWMRPTKDPAKWWDMHGKDCPELQRLAIRLLNLTCSSCGNEQTWNAYEQVYPQKKSRLYQKTPNDLFLLIQNFKSRTDEPKLKDFGALMQLPSDNELITAEEVGQVSGAKKDMAADVEAWLSLDTPIAYMAVGADTENFK